MDSDEVIGSGPYALSQFIAEQQAVLEANPEYLGTRSGKANQVIVKLYTDPCSLRSDIGTSQVDVAWRTLSPTDLADLGTTDGLSVLEGDGSEFRYWVWYLDNPEPGELAVRQAASYLIDRAEITQDAYDGTTTPAYSLVPPGFAGQKESFKEMYGEAPDPAAAEQVLKDAGVKTPVPLTLAFPPDKYGPNSVDEANILAAQLNDSGLFDVTVEDDQYAEYQNLYREGAYDLYMLGWYPDFLDADNYLSPFIRDGGLLRQRLLRRRGQRPPRPGAGRDRRGRPQRRVRSAAGPRRPRRAGAALVERQERGRRDRRHDRRRRDPGPDVHLPDLGHRQAVIP